MVFRKFRSLELLCLTFDNPRGADTSGFQVSDPQPVSVRAALQETPNPISPCTLTIHLIRNTCAHASSCNQPIT